MSELLREIEEDIRRERVDKLWQRFGKMAVAASIAIVLATAVVVGWQNFSRSRAQAKTSEFLAAMERLQSGDDKIALEKFSKLAEDRGSSFYPLALMGKAEAQTRTGDADGAKATFAELASTRSELGKFGALMSSETKAPARDEAFYFIRSEWAGWRAYGEGKKDEAQVIFSALRDDLSAPASQRARMTLAAPETKE